MIEDGNNERQAAFVCQAGSIKEAYLRYKVLQKDLYGWRFIFSSSQGAVPGFSINKNFGARGAIRSLLALDNTLVLDELTVADMERGRAVYPFDYSISLDTMALSYLEPFLQKNLAKLPADFFEVFEFISRPAVNVDPLPYMQENHWNVLAEEKKMRILEELRSYEVLRRIDRTLLETESRIQPLVSDHEIELGARKLLNSMLSKHEDDADGRTYTDTLRCRHLAFYCVLMKMVEIKLRGKGHLNKMTDDFFTFLHTEMKTIYMREAVIARAYFENGTDLQFFRKVQVNKASIFQELRNMAWDLLHIRHIEQGFVLKPDDRARYYFPAFLTFDYRLTELVDLYPLKAVALSPNSQILPFYFGDALFRVAGGEPDFKDALAEKYFSLKATEERAQRRPDGMSFVEALTPSLETQLASAANVAAPTGSHSRS